MRRVDGHLEVVEGEGADGVADPEGDDDRVAEAVARDREVDLEEVPIVGQRHGDLLERRVLVVGVLEDHLGARRRRLVAGHPPRLLRADHAAPEGEDVAVLRVGRREGAERELRVPVDVEGLDNLPREGAHHCEEGVNHCELRVPVDVEGLDDLEGGEGERGG